MEHNTPVTGAFAISDFGEIKQKVLNWIKQFSTFCFLDNHDYAIEPHTMECLVAAGEKTRISLKAGNALEQLQPFLDIKSRWLFGHLGYGLGVELQKVDSHHPDHVGFADLFFFEPEIVLRINDKEIIIEAADPQSVYQAIIASLTQEEKEEASSPAIHQRFSKNQYIATIQRLREHILRGDCYEINFCQEFFADDASVNPLKLYQQLSSISPNPFSALYRVDDHWLVCASPERFLKKNGRQLLSQPIKGTSSRNQQVENDTAGRDQLLNSAKDRSENVMIVDLVRNDLAKVCEEGSVKVDELYGIYSFPQVHQMISTISGTVRVDMNFSDMIRATFPMGSMTGAPKKKVMELIERYEKTARGIFSGAVGYIDPKGDFDFNVVIRSIMYNAAQKYVSFQAGSGITFYSEPEKEWEECLVKVSAMRRVLGEG